MKRKIYLASSWRNEQQQGLVKLMRDYGHEVYDFKNPSPGNTGFSWSKIDPDYKTKWSNDIDLYSIVLVNHPIAESGFVSDRNALDWCDTCVLLLPCGRSAHIEAGYACGQGKEVFTYLSKDQFEPELMYLLTNAIVTSDAGLMQALNTPLKKTEYISRRN